MKNTLRKFSYTGKDKHGDTDPSGDIHIEGDSRLLFETLCGSSDSGLTENETDKMPTCEGCLGLYNMIKNGKLR